MRALPRRTATPTPARPLILQGTQTLSHSSPMISREISSGARTSCMSRTSVSLTWSHDRKPRLWAARMPLRLTLVTVRVIVVSLCLQSLRGG